MRALHTRHCHKRNKCRKKCCHRHESEGYLVYKAQWINLLWEWNKYFHLRTYWYIMTKWMMVFSPLGYLNDLIYGMDDSCKVFADDLKIGAQFLKRLITYQSANMTLIWYMMLPNLGGCLWVLISVLCWDLREVRPAGLIWVRLLTTMLKFTKIWALWWASSLDFTGMWEFLLTKITLYLLISSLLLFVGRLRLWGSCTFSIFDLY